MKCCSCDIVCVCACVCVQANQSVRLFHREYECYVSAEGSFAESKKVVVEDGKCVVVVVSCSCESSLSVKSTAAGGKQTTGY